MKRHITAALCILAVVAGVGWSLASHPETSTGLQHISLIERSEHSHPGSTKASAAVRIRLSPTDFNGEIRAAASEVPHIALASE